MNKKIIAVALLSLACVASAQAQSLKDLLLKMPSEVCPLLTEYNKLELVDNQKNGKEMVTSNALNHDSKLVELSDGYAYLKTTKNTEKVFKILKRRGGEKVIAVVSTVYVDDMPDSSIEFYDLEWQKLDASKMMAEPTTKEFRYIQLNKENTDMHIVYGDPLELVLDGSNAMPKVKTRTENRTWNGERFE